MEEYLEGRVPLQSCLFIWDATHDKILTVDNLIRTSEVPVYCLKKVRGDCQSSFTTLQGGTL